MRRTGIRDGRPLVSVEGSHYFPPESLDKRYFARSRMKTLCPWKGLASYYHLSSEHGRLANGAWYYPHPSPLARRIRNHVAFYPPVTIEGESEPEPEPETQGGQRGRRRLFRRATS